MLRLLTEKHIDEEFKEAPPSKRGAEFYDCTFHRLAGVDLLDCTLYGSKFVMKNPEDVIGLGITLDCYTFNNLELSPEVFDFLMLLICKTKGNNEKRRVILENVVGHDRAIELLRTFKNLER